MFPSPRSDHQESDDPVSLVYHQLGLHLTHGGVEVVLDDLADLGRDLRLELLHELGAVVVHIPGQDKMQRRANEQGPLGRWRGEMLMYPKKSYKNLRDVFAKPGLQEWRNFSGQQEPSFLV